MVEKAFGEDVVRGVIRGEGVGLPSFVRAGKGEKVGDNVQLPPYVLRCEAAVEPGQESCEVSRHQQVGVVGPFFVVELRRFEEPPDRRGAVADCEYAGLLAIGGQALQPHVDDHSHELQKVVHAWVASERVVVGQLEPPSLP
jgi:hypothetical protein